MFFKTLTLMLSLATAVTPRSVKRDESTKLYAYGKGISGFEVYAGLNGESQSVNSRNFGRTTTHITNTQGRPTLLLHLVPTSLS